MTLFIGLLIPLLGTMLGTAFVFLKKDEMPLRLQKLLLGFASGVMVAASVWSLLIYRSGFSRNLHSITAEWPKIDDGSL
jgi:zinc transporter ZupT